MENPDIRPFADEFWNPRFDGSDVAMYNRFLEILKLTKRGFNGDEIGRTLHMNNVRKYLAGTKKSFLTVLRAEHERLGPPSPGDRWLPLRLRPRGIPDGTWIEVPNSVINFETIDDLVHRLPPLQVSADVLHTFGFSSPQGAIQQRTNLFAHLLGAVVGDFGKDLRTREKFPSMRLSLILSTNKPNSFRFGTYTALCENVSLGVGMHRVGNKPVSNSRYGKSECYTWITPSSPLVAWIFYKCLGLRPGETTTYDPVRMDWLLKTPHEFGVHFIQGLAESDGWPDAFADKTSVVASPNTKLLKKLLEELGCPPRVDYRSLELLTCDTEDAFKLPFFSPRIRSNLYEDLEILAKAKRFPERKRLPQFAVDQIRDFAKSATEASEISLRLASTIGYKVSGRTIRKYMSS